MDPSSALSSVLGPAILAALQAEAPKDQVQALLAQLGQKLDLVLFASTGDTLKLRLPSGQVFEAEGQLPYPVGTRLTVQVQAPASDGGAPRLKLLEASPPAPPAILAPLLQGEAAPLLERLLQAEVPVELRPLLRLLESLQDPAVPQAPPASRILAALETLPAPALQALRQLAPAPSPGLPELAQAVRNWIRSTLQEVMAAPVAAEVVPAPSPGAGPPAAVAAPGISGPAPSPSRTPVPPAPAPVPAAPQAATPLRPPAAPSPAPPPPEMAPGHRTPAAAPAASPAGNRAEKAEVLRVTLLPSGSPAEDPTPAKPPRVPGLPERPLETAENTAPVSAETAGSKGDLAAKQPATPPRVGMELATLLLVRLENQLAARGDSPPEARDPLRALIRQLLQGMEMPAHSKLSPPPAAAGMPRPAAPPSLSHASVATPGTREDLRPAVLGAGPKTPAPVPMELPESWEAWVGGAMKALGNPTVSPREAPFHLAQAREGTAFFELPLPWGTAQAPLQLWIEAGLPEGGEKGRGDEIQRVLLGLSFTTLGETRVGLQRDAAALHVRIWTERPDRLSHQAEELRRELEDGHRTVDLRILPLGDGQTPVPTLRSLLAGTNYQALG